MSKLASYKTSRERPTQASRISWLGWALALSLLMACSSAHYHKRADDQVYTTIQQYEDYLFGKTNEFSINTQYSDRDPEAILPDELIAGRETTNTLHLDLDEALDVAVQNSREYQAEKERLYLAALSLTGARYQFSPQFFGRVQPSISGTFDGEPQGRLPGSIGVSQLLSTGGNLGVTLANDLLKYYTGAPIGVNRQSTVSLLSVNLVQPLLRGFGKNNPAVENLTQAERNVVYAIRSFSLFQNQFAVDVVNDYFSLLNRKVQVRNNYTNYLRRLETTQYMEARAVDRASANDVEDARSSELTARIQYVTSLAAYMDALDAFKVRLGVPLGEQIYLEDEELAQVVAAGAIPVEISKEAAFRMAVDKHMDILNAIDQFEDSKRKISLAADQLRPGLDFTGSIQWSKSGAPDYSEWIAEDWSYNAGLELDLPLDRLSERNDYRRTLINFEASLRSLTLTLDRFKQSIDGGLRSLEEARLNILSQQTQLEVEKRRVEMNTLRLQAGRVNIRDLREAQDALIRAQNDLSQRIVSYLRSRLQLLVDIGVLDASREHFWLSDPLATMLTEAQKGPTALDMPHDTLVPPDRFLEPIQ